MGHAGSGLQGAGSAQSGNHPEAARPVGECCLEDGTVVRFRPITAGDVAAYETMLSLCSPKSLYSRYERLLKSTPREMAEAICGDIPDCDLTLVAEAVVDGKPAIVGIAQLLSDPDHEAAEYAVLIADRWQGRGLGGALTSFCLRVAVELGFGRVIAEFLPDNMRMIRILETRDFRLQRDLQERVVSGQKILADSRPRESTDKGSIRGEAGDPTRRFDER